MRSKSKSPRKLKIRDGEVLGVEPPAAGESGDEAPLVVSPAVPPGPAEVAGASDPGAGASVVAEGSSGRPRRKVKTSAPPKKPATKRTASKGTSKGKGKGKLLVKGLITKGKSKADVESEETDEEELEKLSGMMAISRQTGQPVSKQSKSKPKPSKKRCRDAADPPEPEPDHSDAGGPPDHSDAHHSEEEAHHSDATVVVDSQQSKPPQEEAHPEHPEPDQSDADQLPAPEDGPPKKKRAKTAAEKRSYQLTEEQEEMLAEWLVENPGVWLRGHKL